MYNNYMYAIDRSDEYLAHYGIKGMRWGVRKAIERGNSRKLARAYRKASKKLAKLERQASNGAKYAKRAAAAGAGAAALGGLAVAGTSGISSAMRAAGSTGSRVTRNAGNLLKKAGDAAFTYGRTPGNRTTRLGKLGTRYGKQLSNAGEQLASNAGNISKGARRTATAVSSWGHSNSIAKGVGHELQRANNHFSNALGSTMLKNGNKQAGLKVLENSVNRHNAITNATKNLSNDKVARIGAAAGAAGLAGVAGYNAYRAATTKRAAQKAAQFRSEMNKAFAGTQFANGGSSKAKKRRNRRG